MSTAKSLKRFFLLSFFLHLILLLLFLAQKYKSSEKFTLVHIKESELPSDFAKAPPQQQKPLPPITANPPITSMLTPLQGPNPAYALAASAAGMALPTADSSSENTQEEDKQTDTQPDQPAKESKPKEQKQTLKELAQSIEKQLSQAQSTLERIEKPKKEAKKTVINEKQSAGIKELSPGKDENEDIAESADESIKQAVQDEPVPVKPNIKVSFPTLTGKKLLSMTSGYLKSLKAQGNSLMSRPGENKAPSLEELKYLSYQQLIDEQLMNSWRIVCARNPRRRNTSLSSAASISFEVNQDGSLAYLHLVNSSGDPEFDHLALLSIKHASPFPPIPKHLGITRYRPVGGMYRVEW